MPRVTYVAASGESRTVEGATGASVMETAIRAGVDGIVAECGGSCACATCHVYVDEAFLAIVGPPESLQEDMLDATAAERRPSSRLSCQIRLSPELDGLIVHLPDRQT